MWNARTHSHTCTLATPTDTCGHEARPRENHVTPLGAGLPGPQGDIHTTDTQHTFPSHSQPATRGCTQGRQACMHAHGTLACLSLHGDVLIWKQDGGHPPPAHLAPAHHPVGTGVRGDHNPLQSSTGTPACPRPSGRTASPWPPVLRGPDSCLQPRTNWTRGPPGPG